MMGFGLMSSVLRRPPKHVLVLTRQLFPGSSVQLWFDFACGHPRSSSAPSQTAEKPRCRRS